MTLRFLSGLVAVSLLFILGCKEPAGATGGGTGGTTGAALYAFDTTSSTVFVWTDLGALYTTTTATPTRTLNSSAFTKVTNLAWGGVCLDSSRGILYLVSADGNIVRVKNLRSQTGGIASTDVVSFKLASSSFLNGGSFGQVAIDPSTDTLYITENASSDTRIWVVTGASSQFQDASITLQALQVSGDSGGYSVAAASGSVYAFLKGGNDVGTVDKLAGARLRKGTSAAFSTANTLIGSATTLGIYGSLAFDTANNYLFVARHNTDAASTLVPVLVFKSGQFGVSYNQAPSFTLGSPTAQADLRVIAHGGSKDWLVGLSGLGTTGYAKVHIWKSPLGGAAAVAVSTTSGAVLKGLAVDGNAS